MTPAIFSGMVIISGSIDPPKKNQKVGGLFYLKRRLTILCRVPCALPMRNCGSLKKIWSICRPIFQNYLPCLFYSWRNRYLGTSGKCGLWKEKADQCQPCGGKINSGGKPLYSMDKIQRNKRSIVKIILMRKSHFWGL